MTISRLDYSKNSGPFHTVSFHRCWTFSNNFQSAKFSREGQCGRIGGPPLLHCGANVEIACRNGRNTSASNCALFNRRNEISIPRKTLARAPTLGGKRSRIRPHRWVNRTERIESLLVVAFIPDSLENCTRRRTRRGASAGGFEGFGGSSCNNRAMSRQICGEQILTSYCAHVWAPFSAPPLLLTAAFRFTSRLLHSPILSLVSVIDSFLRDPLLPRGFQFLPLSLCLYLGDGSFFIISIDLLALEEEKIYRIVLI